ncbi:MAG: methyltransferase domain-containing protein [Pseudomonadota bacterium]
MSVEARLEWSSPVASHVDRLLVREAALQASGRWAAAGETVRAGGEAAMDALPWCQPAGQPPLRVARGRLRMQAEPLAGRFYPRLAFVDLAQGPRDLRPLRVLECDAESLRVDPNHPLAEFAPRLLLRGSALEPAPGARLADLFEGPGLQVPPADPYAAYYAPALMARQDEAGDALFYAQPRLVHHLDAACRGEIAALYGRFLRPGMRVLDLMASWDSHLPAAADLHVAGLGLNRDELAANPRLAEQVVKDLNARGDLPWGDAGFDLAVCTASIEYLLRPAEVVAEAARVLRPGGVFAVSFSDRWFPPKAVRVWTELHPFERLAWVLDLFLRAGFTDLHTETLRGLLRPPDDKYAEQRVHADPLFAVWGRRPG